MQITMQSTRLAWPAKAKLRLTRDSEGNRNDEWTFCRGQETIQE